MTALAGHEHHRKPHDPSVPPEPPEPLPAEDPDWGEDDDALEGDEDVPLPGEALEGDEDVPLPGG